MVFLLGVKSIAETGSGAEDEGSDGGLAAAEDVGDLGGSELVDGGEKEDVAFAAGEAFELKEDRPDLLGLVECLIGGDGGGDEGLGEGVVHLLGADAAPAIEG